MIVHSILNVSQYLQWGLLTLSLAYLIQLAVGRIKFIRRINKLPTIPGAYPIVGHMLTLRGGLKVMMDAIRKFRETSPDEGMICVWMGPLPYVYLCQAETVEPILSSSKHVHKSLQYKFMALITGNGLLTISPEVWRFRRRLLTPAFHYKVLENFIGTMNEETGVLMKQIDKFADTAESFDISQYFNLCALDILVASTMGVRISSLEKSDTEYVTTIHKVAETYNKMYFNPIYYWTWTLNFSSVGKELKRYLRTIHGMTRRVIEEYKKEIRLEKLRQVTRREGEEGEVKKKKMAFLELLLTASENGKMLTNEEVCQEVDTLMAAGHDTTTAALCWAMVCLGSYPECQAKIQDELEEIFGDSERPATNEDLKKMKYLECIIKETLRFYPAGPVFGRLLTEDVKIGKYVLPAGTTVAVLTNQIHRNEKYFSEPDKFIPERFLPENSAGRHPYAYLAFSGGPRNCIGAKFAVMEQKVILSTLFRKYEVTFVDNMKTVKAHTSITLKPQGSVRIKIQTRQR